MTDSMLTVQDVAAYTGLTAPTVRAAIADGELQATRLRHRYLISRPALLDWLEAGRVRRPRDPMTTSSAPLVELCDRPLEGSVRELVRRQRRDAA